MKDGKVESWKESLYYASYGIFYDTTHLTFPDLKMEDIFGVQPLTAPTGESFKLKIVYSYDKEKK